MEIPIKHRKVRHYFSQVERHALIGNVAERDKTNISRLAILTKGKGAFLARYKPKQKLLSKHGGPQEKLTINVPDGFYMDSDGDCFPIGWQGRQAASPSSDEGKKRGRSKKRKDERKKRGVSESSGGGSWVQPKIQLTSGGITTGYLTPASPSSSPERRTSPKKVLPNMVYDEYSRIVNPDWITATALAEKERLTLPKIDTNDGKKELHFEIEKKKHTGRHPGKHGDKHAAGSRAGRAAPYGRYGGMDHTMSDSQSEMSLSKTSHMALPAVQKTKAGTELFQGIREKAQLRSTVGAPKRSTRRGTLPSIDAKHRSKSDAVLATVSGKNLHSSGTHAIGLGKGTCGSSSSETKVTWDDEGNDSYKEAPSLSASGRTAQLVRSGYSSARTCSMFRQGTLTNLEDQLSGSGPKMTRKKIGTNRRKRPSSRMRNIVGSSRVRETERRTATLVLQKDRGPEAVAHIVNRAFQLLEEKPGWRAFNDDDDVHLRLATLMAFAVTDKLPQDEKDQFDPDHPFAGVCMRRLVTQAVADFLWEELGDDPEKDVEEFEVEKLRKIASVVGGPGVRKEKSVVVFEDDTEFDTDHAKIVISKMMDQLLCKDGEEEEEGEIGEGQFEAPEEGPAPAVSAIPEDEEEECEDVDAGAVPNYITTSQMTRLVEKNIRSRKQVGGNQFKRLKNGKVVLNHKRRASRQTAQELEALGLSTKDSIRGMLPELDEDNARFFADLDLDPQLFAKLHAAEKRDLLPDEVFKFLRMREAKNAADEASRKVKSVLKTTAPSLSASAVQRGNDAGGEGSPNSLGQTPLGKYGQEAEDSMRKLRAAMQQHIKNPKIIRMMQLGNFDFTGFRDVVLRGGKSVKYALENLLVYLQPPLWAKPLERTQFIQLLAEKAQVCSVSEAKDTYDLLCMKMRTKRRSICTEFLLKSQNATQVMPSVKKELLNDAAQAHENEDDNFTPADTGMSNKTKEANMHEHGHRNEHHRDTSVGNLGARRDTVLGTAVEGLNSKGMSAGVAFRKGAKAFQAMRSFSGESVLLGASQTAPRGLSKNARGSLAEESNFGTSSKVAGLHRCSTHVIHDAPSEAGSHHIGGRESVFVSHGAKGRHTHGTKRRSMIAAVPATVQIIKHNVSVSQLESYMKNPNPVGGLKDSKKNQIFLSKKEREAADAPKGEGDKKDDRKKDEELELLQGKKDENEDQKEGARKEAAEHPKKETGGKEEAGASSAAEVFHLARENAPVTFTTLEQLLLSLGCDTDTKEDSSGVSCLVNLRRRMLENYECLYDAFTVMQSQHMNMNVNPEEGREATTNLGGDTEVRFKKTWVHHTPPDLHRIVSRIIEDYPVAKVQELFNLIDQPQPSMGKVSLRELLIALSIVSPNLHVEYARAKMIARYGDLQTGIRDVISPAEILKTMKKRFPEVRGKEKREQHKSSAGKPDDPMTTTGGQHGRKSSKMMATLLVVQQTPATNKSMGRRGSKHQLQSVGPGGHDAEVHKSGQIVVNLGTDGHIEDFLMHPKGETYDNSDKQDFSLRKMIDSFGSNNFTSNIFVASKMYHEVVFPKPPPRNKENAGANAGPNGPNSTIRCPSVTMGPGVTPHPGSAAHAVSAAKTDVVDDKGEKKEPEEKPLPLVVINGNGVPLGMYREQPVPVNIRVHNQGIMQAGGSPDDSAVRTNDQFLTPQKDGNPPASGFFGTTAMNAALNGSLTQFTGAVDSVAMGSAPFLTPFNSHHYMGQRTYKVQMGTGKRRSATFFNPSNSNDVNKMLHGKIEKENEEQVIRDTFRYLQDNFLRKTIRSDERANEVMSQFCLSFGALLDRLGSRQLGLLNRLETLRVFWACNVRNRPYARIDELRVALQMAGPNPLFDSFREKCHFHLPLISKAFLASSASGDTSVTSSDFENLLESLSISHIDAINIFDNLVSPGVNQLEIWAFLNAVIGSFVPSVIIEEFMHNAKLRTVLEKLMVSEKHTKPMTYEEFTSLCQNCDIKDRRAIQLCFNFLDVDNSEAVFPREILMAFHVKESMVGIRDSQQTGPAAQAALAQVGRLKRRLTRTHSIDLIGSKESSMTEKRKERAAAVAASWVHEFARSFAQAEQLKKIVKASWRVPDAEVIPGGFASLRNLSSGKTAHVSGTGGTAGNRSGVGSAEDGGTGGSVIDATEPQDEAADHSPRRRFNEKYLNYLSGGLRMLNRDVIHGLEEYTKQKNHFAKSQNKMIDDFDTLIATHKTNVKPT